MNIIILLPWLLLFLMFIFLITQIVVPTLKGTQLFPVFRRENRLLAALTRKEQNKQEETLVKKLME